MYAKRQLLCKMEKNTGFCNLVSVKWLNIIKNSVFLRKICMK